MEEIFKLDKIDRQVLFYLMSASPHQVESWIDYLAIDYKEKKINLNGGKLWQDVKDCLEREKDYKEPLGMTS